MVRSSSLLFLVAVLASDATAQIIRVTGGGSALATAVAQAPDGAVLEVAPGTYDGFAIQLTKNVNIVAPQRATVVGAIQPTAASSQWTLRLQGLAVSRRTVFPFDGGVIVADCNLHLEDCTGYSLFVNGTAPRVLYARGCTFGGLYQGNQLINVDAAILDSSFSGGSDSGRFGSTGLTVRGLLRAERLTATGIASTFRGGPGLEIDGTATVANSSCVGGGSSTGQAPSIVNQPPGALTLWASSTPHGVLNTYVARQLATASWSQRNWAIGGTSVLRFSEAPQAPVLVVLAWDLVPWSASFAAERLYFGATPNWLAWSAGVTDAQGAYNETVAIPNDLALRYARFWFTGVFVGQLPVRTTCPLGGVIL